MGLLAWMLFGLLAGIMVMPFMPLRDFGGILLALALGMKGAVLGGCAATLFDFGDIATLDFRSFWLVPAGALVFLAGYRICLGKQGRGLFLGCSTQEN